MNKTLNYYNQNAKMYNDTTKDIAFEEKRSMMLKYLSLPSHILDLGCGSGRDSKAFIQKGYQVTAMDGSAELCKLASQTIGQEVKCLMFDEIDEEMTYDAVWACASLLHIPSSDLLVIFNKINTALKQDGIFYVSFKYGEFEGERESRYFTDFTLESFTAFISQMQQFTILESAISEDVIPGRESLKWLNVILKKER